MSNIVGLRRVITAKAFLISLEVEDELQRH